MPVCTFSKLGRRWRRPILCTTFERRRRFQPARMHRLVTHHCGYQCNSKHPVRSDSPKTWSSR
ncbi:MAG: hypothetical protein FRX49_05773 [Trebouxia sp. A1-2]|nr:MAG: hypothetical protein FRX49_05773 [Trebouxia sp. A1-2]